MSFGLKQETLLNGCGLRYKRIVALIVTAFALAAAAANVQSSGGQKNTPAPVRLGERLFREARFSTPKGDLPASCSTCHLLDEDPQGLRAYTDFLNRSWVSYRLQDPRRNELRNSPTIFDAAQMPRLHFDGEFGSLEELVTGTFAGRPMGWLPGEQEQAFAQIHSVVAADRGSEGASPYRVLFKEAYGVEVEKLRPAETVKYAARAVSEFMRTLNSPRKSPYDQFVRDNGLPAAPAAGQSAQAFGQDMLARIARLEAAGTLKLSRNFSASALRGFQLFLRTEGGQAAGNCVACHAPPYFSDFSFHNIGISQVEYDQKHGAGKFALLEIPGPDKAVRPAAQFRETPTREKPGEVDLGFWNFVELKSRRPGESEEQLLRRMIGAFKTPTLRHLNFTPPYMHTGAYATLAEVLEEKRRLSELARAGQVREADAELLKLKLGTADLAPLADFLNTLNEDLRRRD
jgi:cytochrome c peroxidase